MRAAGICLLALLAGCKSNSDVTAVRVIVNYTLSKYDQFEIHLSVGGTELTPVIRPEVGGNVLGSPQDVVVYVPDAWAGQVATCWVRGLFGGDGTGISFPTAVLVEPHLVVPCAVSLDSPLLDGGVLDAPGVLDGPVGALDALPSEPLESDGRAGEPPDVPLLPLDSLPPSDLSDDVSPPADL